MPYDPERHHRRSTRYPGCDYSQANAYFVTVCARGRAGLFGEVVRGEVELSVAGLMVESWWHEVPVSFPGCLLDAYVVMPNHFHGIVMIGADPANGDGISHESGRHGGLPCSQPTCLASRRHISA